MSSILTAPTWKVFRTFFFLAILVLGLARLQPDGPRKPYEDFPLMAPVNGFVSLMTQCYTMFTPDMQACTIDGQARLTFRAGYLFSAFFENEATYGDLMLLWGPPVLVRKNRHVFRPCWGNRYAMGTFQYVPQPRDRIDFIAYGDCLYGR